MLRLASGGVTLGWLDREEYPFRGRYLDLPMGRMHYLDEGDGPPLVLVHGTPTWSFLFRHLVRRLSARFRCVVPDHIGFGLSDKPREWTYLPADHAANLEALVGHLGLERPSLLVHDYGGPIGLAYALRHPDNVNGLVLFNTWLWAVGDQGSYSLGARVMGGPAGRFLYERFNLSPRRLLPWAFVDRARLTPALHAQYLGPFSRSRDRRSTWVLARELLGSGAWYDTLWERRAALVEHPMLIAWGLRDRFMRRAFLERWERAFPGARVVRYENAGHFLLEEEPDDVGVVVEEFLSRITPSPTRPGGGS